MTGFRKRKGLILFGLILLIIVTASLAAYRLTGSMGIEERYIHAVGLPGSEEDSGSGWFGFSLEGDPVLYALVLGTLVVACFAAYRYGKL
jgi:hypothetical protein